MTDHSERTGETDRARSAQMAARAMTAVRGGLAVAASVWLVGTLALVALGGSSAAVGVFDEAAGPDQPLAFDDTEQQVNIEDPSERVSAFIAAQNQSIRGVVREQSLRSQLEAAGSPSERAAVLDQQLDELETRTARLERTIETSSESVTARAGVAVESRSLADLLEEIHRAAASLSAEDREQLEASQIETLRGRVATLRQQTAAAADAIEGENVDTAVDPLSFADLRAAAPEQLDVAERLDRIVGSQQIELRVRRANGSVLRAGVVTDGRTVVSIERGPVDNPDVRMYTDYRVVRDMQRSEDPFAAFREGVRDGQVIYDGTGLVDSVRYGIVSFFN